ncbi:unnamed protein product, partial [Brachionus calyciflorus]
NDNDDDPDIDEEDEIFRKCLFH